MANEQTRGLDILSWAELIPERGHKANEQASALSVASSVELTEGTDRPSDAGDQAPSSL